MMGQQSGQISTMILTNTPPSRGKHELFMVKAPNEA